MGDFSSTPKNLESAVGSGGEGAVRPVRKFSGSRVTTNYGQRTVKSYPITESELSELTLIGTATSTFSSFGFFFVTKSIDLGFNLFNQQFNLHNTTMFIFGTILLIISACFLLFGKNKLASIKEETNFTNP